MIHEELGELIDSWRTTWLPRLDLLLVLEFRKEQHK